MLRGGRSHPDTCGVRALGQVKDCPFDPVAIKGLKDEIVPSLASGGLQLIRQPEERIDVPGDFRCLALLLRAACDPGRFSWQFLFTCTGGARRASPAPFCSLPQEAEMATSNPDDLVEDRPDGAGVWQRNHASVAGLTNKVLEVLKDQSTRGQVRTSARRKREEHIRIWKDKRTARVLFDGTNGISIFRRTRIRDQADRKRVMREKTRQGELTFALAADVTEAHRQIPRDWHLLGCQG